MTDKEIHIAALKKMGGILAMIAIGFSLILGLVCGIDWLSDHAPWALWVLGGLITFGWIYEICRYSVEREAGLSPKREEIEL